MNQSAFTKILGLVVSCVLVGSCLMACVSEVDQRRTEGIAATVGEVEIPEEKVTAYIQSLRTAWQIDTETAWEAWLVENEKTPALIREAVIDHFIDQEVLLGAAASWGLSLSEDEIDKAIVDLQKEYENEEEWKAELAQANMSEEDHRKIVELSLLEHYLKQVVAQEQGAVDEDQTEEAFNTWVAEHRSTFEIEVFHMPENLPYNINEPDSQ